MRICSECGNGLEIHIFESVEKKIVALRRSEGKFEGKELRVEK